MVGNDTRSGNAHGLNEQLLFWASFFTLIAAGIGFSVRGVILKDWGQQFGFTQGELGTITGGGLLAFGVAIIGFSFFADLFGYGKLMLVAFLLHASSAVVTFAARGADVFRFGSSGITHSSGVMVPSAARFTGTGTISTCCGTLCTPMVDAKTPTAPEAPGSATRKSPSVT